MRSICLILLLAVAVSASHNFLSDEYIAEINKKATTWKAGRNFDPNTPMRELKKLTGVLPEKLRSNLKMVVHEADGEIPASFDARKAWPNCQSIGTLSDQSNCGSCWAMAATGAMSDRICIHSGQKQQTLVSAENLVSCCLDCGRGCRGGHPDAAWSYWQDVGIVTGGLYNTTDGCQAYSMPPCEHYTEGSRPDCDDLNGGEVFPTPACRDSCDERSSLSYEKSKTYGKSIYGVSGDPTNIQRDIMKNGPVEASFDVFADFVHYKSGIYHATTDLNLGRHAVRIIGWGEENGVPYWLIANSWNSDWGEQGYFRIIRGRNECGIEGAIVAGLPRL